MLFEINFYSASNNNFVDMTMNIVNRMAPLKQKFFRANNSNFMKKGLRKAMVHRSKLKKKLYKLKTESAHAEYRKERNLCIYLIKKAKKEYYSKLNLKNTTDNKRFWRTVKPLFPDNSIFQDELVVAEKCSESFSNTMKNLEIQFKYGDITSRLSTKTMLFLPIRF